MTDEQKNRAEGRREALREAEVLAVETCNNIAEGWRESPGADRSGEIAAYNCAIFTSRAISALLDAELPAQPKPDEVREALEWVESRRSAAVSRADRISAPEDEAVRLLCERHGYGAVMDSASRQWVKKDGRGAFFIGGSVGDKSYKAALRALDGGDIHD